MFSNITYYLHLTFGTRHLRTSRFEISYMFMTSLNVLCCVHHIEEEKISYITRIRTNGLASILKFLWFLWQLNIQMYTNTNIQIQQILNWYEVQCEYSGQICSNINYIIEKRKIILEISVFLCKLWNCRWTGQTLVNCNWLIV